jgi:GAF domain-containing protein
LITPGIHQAIDRLVLLMPGLATLGEALQQIASVALTGVPGCSGASVTVESDDIPFAIGASDDRVQNLDMVQSQRDGGPCVEALRLGEVVTITEMASEQRWPTFVRAAAEAGITQTLSVPLFVADRKVGVLNLYSDGSPDFLGPGREAAEALANRAGAAATAARLYFDSRTLAEGLSRAIESRSVIEQAKGILMSQNRCGPDEAFAILTRASQNRNVKLRDLAAQVVASVTSQEAQAD